MNDEDFEELVNLICRKILGTGTVVYSKGTDGGRDGKFEGKANNLPSDVKQLEGKFIIQSKHTTKINASCSDSEFDTKITKEIKKVRELKKQGEIDYYLLFTNRKLTGNKDAEIKKRIFEETGIENRIFGLESILLWLKEYPRIAEISKLNKLLMPLQFYEKDLQDIITSFSEANITEKALRNIQKTTSRIPIEKKNGLNNLSKEYFDNVIKESYSEFNQIDSFLKDPQNAEFKGKYDNTVSDLKDEIMIKRNEYGAFEEILNHLFKLVLDSSNKKLLNNRKLIRIFLHYMYANCDIGIEE
ncbi:MAG: hypothetical protein GY865_01835 [candidate division Zixibacteria bacterium]|nr:hypothetical protein [candidate division Zixibacteria bacterium]